MLTALLDFVAPALTVLVWISLGVLAVAACAAVGAATLAGLFAVRAAVHGVVDVWMRVAYRERGSRLPSTAALHDLLRRPASTDTRPLPAV